MYLFQISFIIFLFSQKFHVTDIALERGLAFIILICSFNNQMLLYAQPLLFNALIVQKLMHPAL